ncbi:putative polypeptide N-acetylgalactosaminyltransferase 9 [Anopheles cruzii]|uniref:putative polypeptide N-acetylgalactosaminyltransferase 9 n=1 Tax=Anopheles cruzii TaxID=68878 RepID=UPI0022EC31E0|nr:putative polypeptide N-acetylgalactosaminyltransferase 9 [Anopheles cruzii]
MAATHFWCCALKVLVAILIFANVLYYRFSDWYYVTVLTNGPSQKISFFGRQDAVNYSSLPGHLGSAVEFDFSDQAIASLVSGSIERYGFNEYASALIPLRRVLPDLRDPWCEGDRVQRQRLPPTAIVIVFYNEPWSALLRTVHSVLDHSPVELVQEIVLVDDFSSFPFLQNELEEYWRPYPQVRIIRAPKRLGLIRARILGAKSTRAPLLTFLDAHVECTTGWLEPLLDQVDRNETTIAVPLIDRIDDNDLQLIVNVSSQLVGAFEWDLNFGWWQRSMLPARNSVDRAPYEPFESPAMAGGLFSISRRFFTRLGWYDEGFGVYGMENAELSIKSWMCGGRIVAVPCSHVAHIRKSSHPFIGAAQQNVTFLNSVRVAEVWMDEYKRVVFDANGIRRYTEELFGSVADRKAVRAGAGCRTFQYYLERAYPEMPSPIVPGQFRGEVRNAALGNGTCLTVRSLGNTPTMEDCGQQKPAQFWAHNFYQELNSYRRCLEAEPVLKITACHRHRGSQAWNYNPDSMQLRSIPKQQCLSIVSVTDNRTELTLEPCEEHKLAQQWYAQLTEYGFWKQLQ